MAASASRLSVEASRVRAVSVREWLRGKLLSTVAEIFDTVKV